MRIKRLLFKACIKNEYPVLNHVIHKLTDDSRAVEENDVFFAIKGYQCNGEDYINDAIKNGAKTIFYEGSIVKENHYINYIEVDDVRQTLAIVAKIFYHDITKRMKLIGVTGTNGKTTITTVLMDFLSYSGYDPVLIGTNGIYFKEEHFYSDNTTPNILEVYDVLKVTYQKGARIAIMEVSSIGIREARLMFFDFDIVVFTNLTHDHLDYHKNITDYKFSKAAFLWDMPRKKNKIIILNKDDENYHFYLRLIKAKTLSYGIIERSDYQAINVVKSLYETQFRIIVRNNKYSIKSSLVGGFNVYNILAMIAVVDFMKLNILSFIEFLRIYVSVSGRMNRISFDSKTVIIDFAHTPSSVLGVLSSLKEYSNHKLTVILGCGGNRDQSKRAIMGQIVERYADKIIITNDNPRDESPMDIAYDITSKMNTLNYEIILDRKKAIWYALETSVKDEVIAILGKGAERNQVIRGIKYPFSDKEVVYEYMKKR